MTSMDIAAERGEPLISLLDDDAEVDIRAAVETNDAAVDRMVVSRSGKKLLDAAIRIADDVIAPTAQDNDRADLVPTSHLEALAEAGLFDLTACSPQETRRIMAAIAGACGATFFVWVQHHGVLRQLSQSPNRTLADPLVPGLSTGDLVAGFTMAHLRRPGPPAVKAGRIDGGWRLDGFAPWATSWGIADWFAVAAESEHGEMVWALLPGKDTPDHSVRESMIPTPLNLPLLTSTGTVSLRFDDCRISDAEVIEITDAAEWRHDDRFVRAPGAPAVLGVAARAIALLAEAKPGDDDRLAAAERLSVELDELWAADDRHMVALSAPDRSDDTIAAASDHRAACLFFGQRATTALLAASGGGGMDLSNPAQRLAREAMFYIIQAQTADGRSGTLRNI